MCLSCKNDQWIDNDYEWSCHHMISRWHNPCFLWVDHSSGKPTTAFDWICEWFSSIWNPEFHVYCCLYLLLVLCCRKVGKTPVKQCRTNRRKRQFAIFQGRRWSIVDGPSMLDDGSSLSVFSCSILWCQLHLYYCEVGAQNQFFLSRSDSRGFSGRMLMVTGKLQYTCWNMYVSFSTFMCNKNIICRVCIEQYLPNNRSLHWSNNQLRVYTKQRKNPTVDMEVSWWFPKMGGTPNPLNFDHLFMRLLGIDT